MEPSEKSSSTQLTKVTSVILDLLTLGIGIGVILYAAYFFGFNFLREPLRGSDAVNILNYASWLNEYYPSIPLWYPLQGGGVSFVLGYPSLYAVILVWLHRVFDLNMLVAMSYMNFASLVVPAIGVFLFVLTRFRLRIAALFAGLLFFFSPFSYALVSGGGFLANALANVFAVFILIFFDWFLISFLENKSKVKTATALLFGSIAFMLTTLAHPVASIGFAILMLLYFPVIGFTQEGKHGLIRAVVAFLIIGLFSLGLSFFWFVPFSKYTSISNRDLTFTADTSVMPPITIKSVLGVVRNDFVLLVNLSIHPFVWVIATLGLFVGIMRRKWRFVMLYILFVIGVVFMGTTKIWEIATNLHWLLGSFISHRYYFTSTILLAPIIGGVGLWYVANIPFEWFKRFLPDKHFIVKLLADGLISISSLIVALGISFFGIKSLNSFNGLYTDNEPWMLHVGEETGIDSRSIWNRPVPNYPCVKFPEGDTRRNWRCDDKNLTAHTDVNLLITKCEDYPWANANETICNGKVDGNGVTQPPSESDIAAFKNRCLNENEPQYVHDICLAFDITFYAQINNPPRPFVVSDWTSDDLTTSEVGRSLSLQDGNVRIDVSPSIGAWVKEWNINNRSSLINAYTGQLVLNKPFQSYFLDVMYSKDFGQFPHVTNQLAQYFGTSAIISGDSDQSSKFENDGWQKSELDNVTLWQNSLDTSLYTTENKPMVLVIGSDERQAYNQVFKVATMGSLSYEKAILVEGHENLDSYSADELSHYDLIILHGYSYKNKSNAYNILKSYLNSGGNVFIDTGWQYVTPDWGSVTGSTTMHDTLPVSTTTWGEIEGNWASARIDSQFTNDIQIQDFSPLTWGDMPWSLAYAKTSELKEWGKPLISFQDKVIAAYGMYGEGKVVWSGMNLISHVRDSGKKSEIEFLGNIFSYLVPESGSSSPIREFTRTPDRLEFTLSANQKAVYFRESYYPYWHAYAVEGNKKTELVIQSAGPRFMLIDTRNLSPETKVIFVFEPDLMFKFDTIVSIFTFVVLLLLLLDAILGSKILKSISSLTKPMTSRVGGTLEKHQSKIKKSMSSEDFDY